MNARPGAAGADAANQPPPYEGRNLYDDDAALCAGVAAQGAAWAQEALRAFGAVAGSAGARALARDANRHPPELLTHDRYGERLDLVDFHPAYHELMTLGCGAGVHSSPWAEPRPGAQVARAAMYLLFGQLENGTQCPLTMTFAAAPVLAGHADALPELARDGLPRIHARAYDRRFVPIEAKQGATIGMGMTERQGGSDVRTNRTEATPFAATGPGQPYRIEGEKWFFSAPMCDAFLILAQAPGGLSCFFLPRFLADGAVNAIRLRRLKDKLGNRSNASSEVEFAGATAWLLGDEGRGVSVILEMVNYTRLDCVIGSAALMREALAQAIHHARHRRAFGRVLAGHALMQNVLADLALESEAATALALRLAGAYDGDAAGEVALRRVLTPAAKFWICKRTAAFVQEAMEVLGGNGYVEESVLPRLYREAPLNSIWEGSGNIMCLDVLRALGREGGGAAALATELAAAQGGNPAFDVFAARLLEDIASDAPDEAQARRFAGRLVRAVQASLLLRHAPEKIAAAFCASRLGGADGRVFGALVDTGVCAAIAARALPA
ncbi:MAG: isovaleryl-CoA dehydrogenase [Gammaproteobacteria bacterium]